MVYADGPDPVAIYTVTSTNQGQSFGKPLVVPAGSEGTASVGVLELISSLSAATDSQDGTLYVTFATNHTGTGHMDVVLTRSADGGQTWSAPVRVNDQTNQDDHFQPQLAVTPDGTVYISYFTYAQGRINLFLAKSTTHGANFSPNQRITTVSWNASNGERGSFIGERQGLAVGPTSIYPCWNDGRSGQLQIFEANVPLK